MGYKKGGVAIFLLLLFSTMPNAHTMVTKDVSSHRGSIHLSFLHTSHIIRVFQGVDKVCHKWH